MIQFGGGYRFPVWPILVLLTLLVLFSVAIVRPHLSGGSVLALLIELEAGVLMLSALTPVGLLPPPDGCSHGGK